ncbi:MAG: hypothetical protein MJE77_11020 [Proteobacteria bacterium]|nr:hypothetical protein [Pseudomonadota bacterium]
MPRYTHSYFAQQTGRRARQIAGMVRRMTIVATYAVRWVVHGYSDEAGNVEETAAEVYPGLGYAARPLDDDAAEAIVVQVAGQANHPALIATRDRTAENAAIQRAGLEPGERLLYNHHAQIKLAADGTIIAYNEVAQVKLTASGTIEIGARDGSFQPVALADHTHDFGPLQAGQYTVTAGGAGVKLQTGPSKSNSSKVTVS